MTITHTDSQPVTVDEDGTRADNPQRVFEPHECGRNGNPPPFGYQRRVGTLGPAPKRNGRYRALLAEAAGEAVAEGALTSNERAVLDVLAQASNNQCADIEYLTERQIGQRIIRPGGKGCSAKTASRALDSLRAKGWVDWQHASHEDRILRIERIKVRGRWQGPATYRLTIPPARLAALEDRKNAAARRRRERNAAATPGRTTPSRTAAATPSWAARERTQSDLAERVADEPSGDLIDDLEQARAAARRIATTARSRTIAAALVRGQVTARYHDAAIDELDTAWQSRAGP